MGNPSGSLSTANTYNGQMLGYWCEPDGVLDPIAWFCGNSRAEGPREVATRAANPWGLFDVLGNVAEWNHDWSPLSTPTDAVDPWGPATGTHRVERGGSAYTQTMFARAASMAYAAPGARYKWNGFRIARTR
jgi:formylglycine-generating enzyme required for sulfatase activity